MVPHAGHPEAEELEQPAAPANDRLFDVLCAGVVVLTIALYVIFF